MNREDIIELLLRDQEANFRNRAEAEKALELTLRGIVRGLKARGRKVSLAGFGSFRVVRRKARGGINPNTGEPLKVKAQNVVKFRAGQPLKNKL